MKVLVETVLPVTPHTFWSSLFFNLDYNVGLHQELGFSRYEVLSNTTRPDGCVERVLYTEPPLRGPEIVTRRLGRALSSTEHGVFDPRTQLYTFTHTPALAAGSTHIAGTIRVAPHDKGLLHFVDVDVEISAFGLGSLIERAIESNVRASYRTTAAFTHAYAAQHGLLA